MSYYKKNIIDCGILFFTDGDVNYLLCHSGSDSLVYPLQEALTPYQLATYDQRDRLLNQMLQICSQDPELDESLRCYIEQNNLTFRSRIVHHIGSNIVYFLVKLPIIFYEQDCLKWQTDEIGQSQNVSNTVWLSYADYYRDIERSDMRRHLPLKLAEYLFEG